MSAMSAIFVQDPRGLFEIWKTALEYNRKFGGLSLFPHQIGIFMQTVLFCFSLMKRASEVTQWGIISTCIDKEAKVSFHGSPWNVGDGSCLLTKASLQLLGRTHEIATSPRPVAVILDTFGL